MARKKHDDIGGESDLMERDQSNASEQDHAIDEMATGATGTAEQRLAIKRANFSRLASKRVQRILVGLAVLKNLANTNTYDWNIGQKEKIFEAIDDMLTEVKEAFEVAKKPKTAKSQLTFEV